jgi:iron complex outermembrane receptor protein
MDAGLEGYLYNGISSENAKTYSRIIDARVISGQINRPRMEALLDPSACAADAACPGIWDPFTRGTLTDEQIAYASITHSPVRRQTTTQLLGNISGDMGDFELPGGQILWAAGFEHRTEDYLFMPDGGAAIGAIYYVSGEKTEGAYSIDELYGEVMLPIIADMPFAERVDVTIAVRSSDYDFLEDSATNSKIGVEWVPVEDMLVRATFAEGFRAPSITELFAPQTQSAPSYSDPCRNYGTSGANSTVTANCQADGLAPDFNPDSQAAAVLGGNPGLIPEDSESFTAGIVYSGFDNFSIALDYFDIEITNGVGTAGVNNVAEGCYNSAGFSSPLCDLIKGSKYGPIDTPPHPTSPRRNVSGILSGVLLTNANLSTFQTSGIDFDFTYTTEMMGGEVKASVNGTLLNDYSYSLIEGEEMVEVAGYFAEDQWEGRPATFNELKVNATVTYTADDYSVNVSTRYFSETDDINGTENTYDAIAEAAFYIDLQGTYFINDNYSVSGGVRNLMDEEPPYMSNYDDMNTINGNYDLAGRYFYTKFTAKF